MSIRVGGGQAVVSDSSGSFETNVNGPGTYEALIQGAGIVDRDTTVTVPASDARISLIPSSFDLTAFNELARTNNSQLQRWVTQPALVVIGTVMQYSADVQDGYTASGDTLTDAEVSSLTTQLTQGLSLLTAGTYASFSATTVERPDPGTSVSIKRDGKIVVGRYTGISNGGDGVIGYGAWLEQPDGTVRAGVIYLDQAFDKTDNRRQLLRYHELGHALGYEHVTSRTSIMNPELGPDPTDFDRQAVAVVFQRPPGNRAPDRDPTPVSTYKSIGPGSHWAAPVR